MYIETIKNLMSDEVAETIAALAINQEIAHAGMVYRIPEEIRSATHHVTEWRASVFHGINGNMDVFTEAGNKVGKISVWDLHNILTMETFVIHSDDDDD